MNTDEFMAEYNKFKPEGKPWMMPNGDNESKLMLIMSYPSYDAMEEGSLLKGSNGIELENALKLAGLAETDYYLTSLVKFPIGSLSKPSTKQIEQCSAILKFELEAIKPKLIMTLGSEPFKWVKQENAKVTNYLGNIVDSPFGKLLPNYSPGLVVNQDPTQRPLFREIFDLARRFMEDRLTYQPYEKLIVTDPKVNEMIVAEYIKQGCFKIGYDAEWTVPKSRKMEEEVLYTFQYSCETDKAIILDLCLDGKTENLELLNTMRPLLEHPQVQRMGWNIRADDERLAIRGLRPSDETLFFDGMKACGFLDSRLSKGLETGVKYFTNYKPYYKDGPDMLKKHKLKDHDIALLKFLEPEYFYEYCGGDAVAHRTACLSMKEKIDALPDSLRTYWYDIYLPLTSYFTDLELSGIPIDVDKMEELTNLYQFKYDELLISLKDKLKDINPDFNPNSTPDKKKLLFEQLQLTPAYYTKKGKIKARAWYEKQKVQTQKQYSPSTGGKSLSTISFDLEKEMQVNPGPVLIEKHEIVKNLLNLARVGVFANKFFSKQGTIYDINDEESDIEEVEESEGEDSKKSSYWASLCSDNRIHPSFYECLDNFRSSSRPNVQNPASKVLSHIPNIFVPGYSLMSKEEQKLHSSEVPGNIRHIFWSGGKDWYWAENDIASADLIIAAYLSNDSNYINDMLKGGFHLTKAKEYFQDPNITKDDYSKYVSSKAITFRVAYTAELLAAAVPIQAEIYAESGIYLPVNRVEYALKSWENYDKYMAYRAKCLEQVKEENCITNARGITFYFDDSSDFRIIAGWNNTALAYSVSSELALFMYDICIKLKHQFVKDRLWNKYIFPVDSVHDAAYHILHKDLIKDNYFPEVMKYYFTKHCKIVTGDNLGMEMSVADRWKGKEEVFHGETVWNYNAKSWDWKKPVSGVY